MISEKTLLPLSFVIVLFGAVFWVSSLSFQVSANASNIRGQERDLKTAIELLHNIDKRLIRIETKLKELN